MIPADSRCSQLIACERQTRSIVLGFSAVIYLTALGMDCQFLRFITGEMCRKIFNSCWWLNPRGPWTGLMLTEQECRIKSGLLMCECGEGFLHIPLTDWKLKCKMLHYSNRLLIVADFMLCLCLCSPHWSVANTDLAVAERCWLLVNRNLFCTNFENT